MNRLTGEKMFKQSNVMFIFITLICALFLSCCNVQEKKDTSESALSKDDGLIIQQYCTHRVIKCGYEKYPAIDEYASVEDCQKDLNKKLDSYNQEFPECAMINTDLKLHEFGCLTKKKCDMIYNIERDVVEEDDELCVDKKLQESLEQCEKAKGDSNNADLIKLLYFAE